VFAPDLPAGAPLDEREPEGTRVIRYPALELIPNFPLPRVWTRRWWRAARAAAAVRPDLVVGHTRFFVATALALAQARWLRVPYVHVEHGSDFVQMERRWAGAVARLYDETLGRLVLRAADLRIAVSAAAAGFVRRLAGVDATVVHRGVPLERIAAARPAPRAADLAAGRPLIVYVGRLIDGKGVADLVAAVNALDDDACCAVVGDGPRRADLERAAAAGRAERFAFLGYLPEDEALGWVCAADVVVNPSYTEGLPTTVLWAAACGRAVVATDVGGTPEVLSHGATGLLVPPRDVAALRAALGTLASDPARRAELGAAAKRDVRERFDTEAGAACWLALVRGASAGAGAG
jgi:glycosyltransferase involved in cell wall biosynthesis